MTHKKIIDLNDYFTPRDYQMPIMDAFRRGYKRIIAVLPRRARQRSNVLEPHDRGGY